MRRVEPDSPTINTANIMKQLDYQCPLSLLWLDQYVKEGRKKRVNDRIEESIEACKELNLITEAKVIEGAKGQEKYEFTLNLDY